MRDGWIGDIADFAKYGLIRRLSSGMRLGVVWYRTAHEKCPKALVDYLRKSRPNVYTECDPQLLEAMSRMLAERTECTVDDVAGYGLLPAGTVYHSAPVPFPQGTSNGRASARSAWLQSALVATAGAEVVFLDPDTGILPAEGKPERANERAAEYAYVDEINQFLERGQSVIVIQFGRPGNLEREPVLARTRLDQLATALSTPLGPVVVGWPQSGPSHCRRPE